MPPSVKANSSSPSSSIERLVGSYGDLVYDLCESVLWSPANAQLVFRSIFKEIKQTVKTNPYEEHERAYVLRIACARLLAVASRDSRKLSSSEQVMLDAISDPQSRLRQFEAFFHRLPADDQILLLLHDKYGLAYSEISAAMGLPAGSLKTKRAQALRALEELLWQ